MEASQKGMRMIHVRGDHSVGFNRGKEAVVWVNLQIGCGSEKPKRRVWV